MIYMTSYTYIHAHTHKELSYITTYIYHIKKNKTILLVNLNAVKPEAFPFHIYIYIYFFLE